MRAHLGPRRAGVPVLWGEPRPTRRQRKHARASPRPALWKPLGGAFRALVAAATRHADSVAVAQLLLCLDGALLLAPACRPVAPASPQTG